MPAKGWSSVAIRDELYEQLEKQAAKEHRSVAQYVELQLIDKKIVKPVLTQEAAKQ